MQREAVALKASEDNVKIIPGVVSVAEKTISEKNDQLRKLLQNSILIRGFLQQDHSKIMVGLKRKAELPEKLSNL